MKKIIVISSIVLIFCLFFLNFITRKNSEEKNTVTFATWGSQSEISILNNIISDFEKENKIKVELIHIPQNYFQKVHLLFASNLAPDVIFMNNQNIQLYANANLLEDLSKYFPTIEKEYYNEALNCFKRDNKLYAIPRDISNMVLYYNKDIFKKNKVKFPNEIQNIKELTELTKKITTKNTWGINCEDNPLYWMFFLSSNGGGIISDDKKEIIINKKESIESLNLYKDYIHKYKIAPSKAEAGSMTTAQMFIDGKIAMYLGGRWMFPKFSEVIDFDWNIAKFPSQNNKVYIDSSGWAISRNAKNKEYAIKLIKHLSSYETTNKLTQSGLIVPARIDSAKVFVTTNPKNKVFIDTIVNSKPTPINKNYNRINDILKEKAKLMLEANTSIEETFDEKTIKKLESFL
ncbi:MAG: sugar ABC transporter substrate-binding protein [Candidatus Gastranaerophilales bacterium]|nr:sugar ABC transporter substrate-binding protein [Candidatus Gastranaerophilales bacterium]